MGQTTKTKKSATAVAATKVPVVVQTTKGRKMVADATPPLVTKAAPTVKKVVKKVTAAVPVKKSKVAVKKKINKATSPSSVATATTSTKGQPIFCWVKQGVTDHFATIVDPMVLSLLEKENKEYGSGRKELSTLLPIDTEIEIKWCSTKKNEKVEVSTVKFVAEVNHSTTGAPQRRSSLRSLRK